MNTNKPTLLDLTTSEAAGDLVIGRFALLWQYRRHFAPEDQCNAGVYPSDTYATSFSASSAVRDNRNRSFPDRTDDEFLETALGSTFVLPCKRQVVFRRPAACNAGGNSDTAGLPVR